MTNIINRTIRYLTFICFFGIGMSNALYAQTISVTPSIDSNCLLTVELNDSLGNIPSLYPPYFFSIGGITQNSNLGQASINVNSLTNGVYPIQVIDGNQNYYNSTITINCGQLPNNGGNPSLIDSVGQAPSSCNQCNGEGSVFIASPSGTVYTFSWSDGVVATSATSHQRNDLCPGIYTVVVSDLQGISSNAISLTISCNGTPPQSASCYQSVDAYLDNNGTVTLFPQNLTSTIIDTTRTRAYIVDNLNNISNSYSFNCQNLGYHYLTLLFIDTVQQLPDTCLVLVHVRDSSGYCNGLIGNTNGIVGTSSNASNCSTCDGSFSFINFIDSLLVTGPVAYTWSDGVNGTGVPVRNDLCPNQNYVLSVSDNNGNIHTGVVNVTCNGTNCIDSNNIDTTFTCPNVYTPVCGCDSVTYINSCVAQYQYGVTSWTQGPCGIGNILLTISTTADSPCDSISTGCNGSANIVTTGGVPPYTITWSDTSILGFSPTNLCAGTYTITVQDSFNNVVTNILTIGIDGCVWPGDADDNTVVNNFDLLPIGLFYGNSGPTRTTQGINWMPLQAQDWNNQPTLGLPNPKHADCNGNGSIDSLDIPAILANYGQSFFRSTSNSLVGPAPFMVQNAVARPGDTISTPIILGNSTNALTNAYGVAFTVNYDPQNISPGSIAINFNNSWLGSNLVSVQKNFNNTGRLEIAVTRTDQMAISGYGTIGTLNFTIKDDVFIGKIANRDTIITPLTISSIRLINEYNSEIGTSPLTGIVSISRPTNANIQKINNNLDIDCFPNPTDGILNIHSKSITTLNIRLFTATGQLVQTITNPNAYKNILSTEKLAVGVYFLSVQTDKGVYNEKLQVTR